MRKITGYLTIGEILLWRGSILLILATFVIFDRENYILAYFHGDSLFCSISCQRYLWIYKLDQDGKNTGLTGVFLATAPYFLPKTEPHCQISLSLFLFTQDYPC